MRTTDPNVTTQSVLGFFTGAKLQANQHTGVYLAYVSDNWSNNHHIPHNTIRFQINRLDPNAGWLEAPYTGRGIPPIGTQCVVAFEGVASDSPRVLSLIGWQSSPMIFASATAPYEKDLAVGDLWIQP